MAKKKFDYGDYWASDVYRTNIHGKEQIAAHIRRRYDDYDVDDVGPGIMIGLEITTAKRRINDIDPESDTFGKRIDDPQDPGKNRRQFTILWNDKTIKDFKKLVGTTRLGVTRFFYLYRERTYEAPKEEDFWTKSMSELHDSVVLGREKVLVTMKNNSAKDEE
jgi:hypothetical protein